MGNGCLATAEDMNIAQSSWAEERRRLGGSIWLLLLLKSWNRPQENRPCCGDSIRTKELAKALGIGERQARRQLQRLRRAGYLDLRNTGRGFSIRLKAGDLI